MHKSINLIIALVGYAAAVKQEIDSQVEGNMGQTRTEYKSASIESLDEVQAELEGWYSQKMSPYIKAHRDMVYEAAWAEAEKKHGELQETCDEGTACREEIIKELK
jgi:hypothetical protein